MIEREDEDDGLGDEEDLHVQEKRSCDLRERLLEEVAVEESLLDVRPTGGIDHDQRDRAEEHDRADHRYDDRPTAIAAGRCRAEYPGAAGAAQRTTAALERPSRSSDSGGA